jgi:hypothetical protein
VPSFGYTKSFWCSFLQKGAVTAHLCWESEARQWVELWRLATLKVFGEAFYKKLRKKRRKDTI